jgi:ABC-2 type transport system ATP-binding protein
MLEVKNLTKNFGDITAVDDVSFKINEGKVLGIVGRNGAGKSTIFRSILGLVEPTAGEVLFNGTKINEQVLDTFGYLPEEGSLLPQSSVEAICEYYGSLKLMPKELIRERLQALLQEFDLEEQLFTKAHNLSKGTRQKIQFIVSILHDPDFIILDEPFSGLDPLSVELLEKQILKLKEQGKTIIFSSHIMNHVETLCDDILIINKGKCLLYGNLNEIANSYTLSDGTKPQSLNDIFLDKVGGTDE